jgi:Zn-finger nucleic acid-binding protein
VLAFALMEPPFLVSENAGVGCPRCGRALSVCRVPEGAAGLCCNCYGLWLDNRVAQALVGDALSAAARELLGWASRQPAAQAKPSPQAYRQAADVPATPTAPLCPVCRVALTPYSTDPNRHGVKVALDVCGAHGTWFDRGEAWTLLQAIALKNASLDIELDNDAQERAWAARTKALRGFVAGALAGTMDARKWPLGGG